MGYKIGKKLEKGGYMGAKFELSGLAGIFMDTIYRNESVIAFKTTEGKGIFTFMMFFDKEDEESKDKIYIFMNNTRRMLKLKMYGNHNNGTFYVYLDETQQQWFKEELQLEARNLENPFDFGLFFKRLNAGIPKTCSKIAMSVVRNLWFDGGKKTLKKIMDEPDKNILIGFVKLPESKRPREKTLRKLYIFGKGNDTEIYTFIQRLKKANYTVAWTNDASQRAAEISTLISTLNKEFLN